MAEWKKQDAHKLNGEWKGKRAFRVVGGQWVEQDIVLSSAKVEPSPPDYGEVEKVVLYASQSASQGSATHSGFMLSKTKITNGVRVSMSGTKVQQVYLYLHLLALTSNGYALHLSEVDPSFEATWLPNVTLHLWDNFYTATAPDYENITLYDGGDGGDPTGENTPVPTLPNNVSAIYYDFRIAPASTLSTSFSIKATTVKLNGNEYTPEVYFEDDLRDWLGSYDSASNILTLNYSLPTLWSKKIDPIKYAFVQNQTWGWERDYYDKVIFSDRYVDRVGVTNIYPETVYTRTTEIHGLRSIPEGFIDNTTGSIFSNYGHCVVYFMNPSNEFVTVASQAFRKPDYFSSSGYTLVVYTDNIFIHDALIADYGSLDDTLFSIYHLDGTAWE